MVASATARMVFALTMLMSIETAVTFPECAQPCGQNSVRVQGSVCPARSPEGVRRRFRGGAARGNLTLARQFSEGELQRFRGDAGTP